MIWNPVRPFHFYKYHGTGNDFILADQRKVQLISHADHHLIRQLCDRHFGIGADGLILLENHQELDFRMVYFNSDGKESSMCGNGGRCLLAYAKHLGIIEDHARFQAIDGPHEGVLKANNWVELRMADVPAIRKENDATILDTGSPHYVSFVEDARKINVFEEGRKIRYSKPFAKEGTNVNFVSPLKQGISVSTYERGVERETLSCGTGVTASAMAWALREPGQEHYEISVSTKGGKLLVRFDLLNNRFCNVWLCGPVVEVFRGQIEKLEW